MKITAGISSADAYEACAAAGADEVFFGYVPAWWNSRFGSSMPLNRREALFSNTQIGSRSELMILRSMRDVYGIPAVLTLNSLYYLPEQYPVLADLISDVAALGFNDIIIADPALIFYLQQAGTVPGIHIHLSGEFGEMNTKALAAFAGPLVTRVIFHRHVSIEDMADMIKAGGFSEYEAFALNERCHFHGGFCATVHCDEFEPMCRQPYRLAQMDGTITGMRYEPVKNVIGSSGCALCALPALKAAGITHMKVVGRGAFTDSIVRDIKALRRATVILEDTGTAAEYISVMKREIFNGGCGGECYYDIN